ncbi:MAG: methyl-accepting chemotaxis protein [Lachnospiraceae bacterium]|nr:methyl-accepting chemotaxis protein [Lachnospiraceae bacterium]
MKIIKKSHKIGLTLKVLLLSSCSIIITAIGLSFVASSKMAKLYTSSITDNMLNLATSYGKIIDEELGDNEGNKLSTNEYRNILSKISINGYPTGYAYLCDSSGTTLYHPSEERIGNPVENTAVQGIVADIGSGFIRAPEVIEYIFKGENKYAAFHISEVDHSILIVTLDEKDINATIKEQRNSFLISAAFISLTYIVISLIVALFITRPYKKLVNASEKLRGLDLNDDIEMQKLIKRNDECGTIAKALTGLRKEISEVIFELAEVSSAVQSSSTKIQDLSHQITRQSTSNSADTRELESNMQITAESTEQIEENINRIKGKTSDIELQSTNGSDLAQTVIKRADNLKNSSDISIEKTRSIYKEIREQTTVALAEAKAVDKIQALTNSIRAISTQTSMLSLNAAIEAARAGDQGRGFAVVASEIGDLANQSTEAVNSINTIVTEVSKSVKNMTESINRMISFIDGNVIPSFSELSDVGNQYAADAKSFGESMDIISSLAKELSVSIDEIVYSIDGINNNIGNANDRISAIAGKNADIVKATNLSDDLLLENTKDSEKLNTIVHKFKY